MKKIINGKMYDTESSKMIGKYGNGLGAEDFRYEFEELYITNKGEFFLYGEGGPLSNYSETNGIESWGSWGIFPYNKEKAYHWLEEYNQIEALQEYFSDRIHQKDFTIMKTIMLKTDETKRYFSWEKIMTDFGYTRVTGFEFYRDIFTKNDKYYAIIMLYGKGMIWTDIELLEVDDLKDVIKCADNMWKCRLQK